MAYGSDNQNFYPTADPYGAGLANAMGGGVQAGSDAASIAWRNRKGYNPDSIASMYASQYGQGGSPVGFQGQPAGGGGGMGGAAGGGMISSLMSMF